MKVAFVVSGLTFEHKDTIKSAGFRWQSGDKVWYKIADENNYSDVAHLADLEGLVLDKTEASIFTGLYYKSTGYVPPKPKVTPQYNQTFSYSVGNQIEIKSWLAKNIAKQNELDLCFRNLEITDIHRESNKAILVTVKFVSKIAANCHLCGRDLDKEISRATGIGPVCAKKLGISRGTHENAEATLKFLDQYAEKIGAIGPIWIPKSQIK